MNLVRCLCAAAMVAGCGDANLVHESAHVGDGLSDLKSALTSTNGIHLDNGLNLPNGFNVSNGVNLSNGLNLGNGINLSNGLNLSNGAVFDGVTGPYIAPSAGTDLEKWIDASPSMRLRILTYAIQCALPPTASVRIKYRTTATTVTGVANLAPGWQSGQMTEDEQQKVTACLLARVNAKGERINISMLGPYPGFDTTTSTELATYDAEEAAFFGNVFAPVPRAYMCNSISMGICSTRACLQPDGSCNCGVIKKDTYGCGSGFSYATWGSVPISCTQKTAGGAGGSYFVNCKVDNVSWPFAITTRVPAFPSGHPCGSDGSCKSGTCTNKGFCK